MGITPAAKRANKRQNPTVFQDPTYPMQRYRLLLFAFLLLSVAGCGSLQQDLDIVLPSGPAQLVVEAYLEPNMVPRLSVSESVPYVSEPTLPVPTDVTVVLTLPTGQRDTLRFLPGVTRSTRKAYTHIGRSPLVAHPGDTFKLEVTDTKGRRVTATATMPATVPILTVDWQFNDLTGSARRAYMLCTFKDPAGTGDNYRFMLHRRRLNNDPELDYTVQDRLTDGQDVTLGSSYEFLPNDTVFVSLYHIDEPYYNFMQSVQDARNANANPFSQPAAIRSTVEGGIGVFTVLSYERQRVLLTE